MAQSIALVRKGAEDREEEQIHKQTQAQHGGSFRHRCARQLASVSARQASSSDGWCAFERPVRVWTAAPGSIPCRAVGPAERLNICLSFSPTLRGTREENHFVHPGEDLANILRAV
jgi:hypothetical protein